MLLWYWTYKDQQQEIFHRAERSPPASVVERFNEAAKLGMRDGRAVNGMWLITAEQDHVIRIYGAVPPLIRASHVAHRTREGAKD
jgi:hypothetical protein